MLTICMHYVLLIDFIYCTLQYIIQIFMATILLNENVNMSDFALRPSFDFLLVRYLIIS